MSRKIRSSLAACSVAVTALVGACSTPPPAEPTQRTEPAGLSKPARLVENGGRVGFIDNSNSDQRQRVLLRASERFAIAPNCALEKTGLINSRRAVTVEECSYNLQSQYLAYAGTPIDLVSYRFVDGRLLQMRLEFGRSGSSTGSQVDQIRQSVTQDLRLSGVTSDEEPNRWVVSSDLVELSSGGDQGGAAALQISDAKLIDRVIAWR